MSNLSRRDWFAAMALQGLVASDQKGEVPPEYMVACAVELADLLVKELERSKPKAKPIRPTPTVQLSEDDL